MAKMILIGGSVFVDVDRISVIVQETADPNPNGFKIKNVYYLSGVEALNNVSGSHPDIKTARQEILTVLDAKGVDPELREKLDKANEVS